MTGKVVGLDRIAHHVNLFGLLHKAERVAGVGGAQIDRDHHQIVLDDVRATARSRVDRPEEMKNRIKWKSMR